MLSKRFHRQPLKTRNNTSMKLMTKLTLPVVALLSVAAGNALADSHENQIRLHLQQQEVARQQQDSPTVAVYSSRHEVDRSTRTWEDRSESRYEARHDRRYHTYGTWLKK